MAYVSEALFIVNEENIIIFLATSRIPKTANKLVCFVFPKRASQKQKG